MTYRTKGNRKPVNIMLPAGLHRRAVWYCKRHDMNFSRFVQALIENRLAVEDEQERRNHAEATAPAVER